MYSLFQLNRISNKQHPCVTPLPVLNDSRPCADDLLWEIEPTRAYTDLFIIQYTYISVYALMGFISHNPHSVYTLLVSPWSNLVLTHRSMYNLLINLLSRQSTPTSFGICINVVQFTRSNAFCQAMKHAQNISSMSKLRTDITLSIRIASPDTQCTCNVTLLQWKSNM